VRISQIRGCRYDGSIRFFDADKRLAVISAMDDPLEMIDQMVPLASFRAEIEAATLTPAIETKSTQAD